MRWVLLGLCGCSVLGLYVHTNLLWAAYTKGTARDAWKVMRRLALLVCVLEVSIGLQIGVVSGSWADAVVPIMAAPVIALMMLTSAGTMLLQSSMGKISQAPKAIPTPEPPRQALPDGQDIDETITWLDTPDETPPHSTTPD